MSNFSHLSIKSDVANVTDKTAQARLLVVEDDDLSRNYLQALLGRTYIVDIAENGDAAITQLDEHVYDAVLLDLMLPGGMNGYDLLAHIRALPHASDTPVIIISAKAGARDVAEGLQRGANDYVTKPVDAGVLQARLQTQLQIKELADEKNRTIEKLEAAEKLRGQMTRIASHDLKAPLHNLRIAHHMLRDEVESNKRTQQLLHNMDAGIATMQNVIEDFLDLVALQTDSISFTKQQVWLWETVMSVAMQYEIAAENKDINLLIDDIDGEVYADATRVEQALSNLVSNAIKYSPVGGTVRLWTEQHGDCLRVCISDEGEGVPEEERHLLFTEFAKISSRPTAGENSTGLGLWIVKHLMKKQQGDVGAIFPPEGGSIFWLQLPISDDDDICCHAADT